MKKFEEKTYQSETIYTGKIVQLDVDSVTLPDGNTSKRELIRHPGAVAVIATTKEGKLVLVEQYRKAMEKSIIEIPAGKLEPGEDPKSCAMRELEEETGYATEDLELVTSFYTSPGFADELVYVYFTDNIEPMDIQPDGDEDEFVELMELSLDEAVQLERDQRIHDAKTAYALLYLQLKQK
ncbi:NUDIX domain-containing protein [Halobacillus litoralis]|uniref:NUDIX domain-containing protein n=1 Tax=Halobacillus litoralis TaxID=45668 RepID=A0A845DQ20_9BACI|nr:MULTISPECIES: NUDIX hydrolase [Halobacillus]MYL19496.1 NUDIX domain-containing protein [Halobacillus litoralis]MYL28642.1 NUDIX domain-containing protein [Halobacillus halophilus]MYL37927.1 NUDIX domain-containing protein [Halobacillus litoralis]